MELPFEVTERIIWGACGLLSFVLLILWLRWMGTPEDQKKDEPPEQPKRQEEND